MTRIFLFLLSLAVSAQTSLPSFPNAEGFGGYTPGGRGGEVYAVVNLNDSGPGSFRNGIQSAWGPRTIVFAVSGTIALASPLSIGKPNLTIAGQTAPGDGITLSGWTVTVSNTRDVIIRYLRFRAGDANCPKMQGDALWINKSTDVILDHVSASWSIDETLSVTESDRITVQWSFITESLEASCHEKGPHGYGTLMRYGSGGYSFHHNLYAHHRSRNPRIGDNLRVDFVNNVIYNYGSRGGEAGYSGAADEGITRINYSGNFGVSGPSTDVSRRNRVFLGGSANTHIYQSGNYIDPNLNQVRDGSDTGWGMFAGAYSKQTARFDYPLIRSDTAPAAYVRVIGEAGASLARDAVDLRIAAEVKEEKGRIVNSQNDAGGFPVLRTAAAPSDTDGDGIPDGWEREKGLNPDDAADGAKLAAGGYSNLELYLDDIIVTKPGEAGPKPLLDDRFADGDSQNQDLANHSIWLFNGRTNNIRTDAPGSVTLDVTPAGTSSEAVWGFFTNAGSPVSLGVGDLLRVSVEFSVSGFKNNGQDIRFGVLDSLGTRNTGNLGGGHNDATFINDTGYGLQYYPSGRGSPFVLGRRSVLSNANMFNNFADFTPVPGSGATERKALTDDTPNALTYTIERLTATTTRLSVEVSGLTVYQGIEANPNPNTAFDSFAFRVAGTNFADKLTFTGVTVWYVPGAPRITAQPQPAALTLQVGSSAVFTVGAEGSEIAYEWLKNGLPVAANASARTHTLTLSMVRLSDAGSYTAEVFNAGGRVVSAAVMLQVSTAPVPPPPAITRQPADTTTVIGQTAMLSVTATGAGLVYQWFKNGAPLANERAAELTIPGARITDSASYSVVVSNSSGSIASRGAALSIVSAMTANSAFPWPGYPGLCADAPLSIDFDREIRVGKSGRIRVTDSTGRVVDTIDLSASPQSRVIGGTSFTYYPVLASGRRARITLHAALPYGERYTVTVDPGVITDVQGAPWTGFTDPSFWSFRTRTAAPAAGLRQLIVSADDGGDFCTVQGAIDYVPAGNTQPVNIYVNAGIYNEINYIPSSKPFITIRGADREKTVIQYANNANLNQGNARAMFGVDAPDFTLEDITLWNTTPKGGSQAEAFRGNNRRILLNRVNLKSFQDTLLLQGAAMVNDSYIEGDVDFLWGGGAVFVRNSEIKALSSGGYYTQIRNGQGQNGYVFLNSRLTAAEGVTGVYLSRVDPIVFPYSQVVFINCVMGPHVIPSGWQINNATAAPNVSFFEFESVTAGGARIDVSQRAPFSRQISAAEAARLADPGLFLGGWTPELFRLKGKR